MWLLRSLDGSADERSVFKAPQTKYVFQINVWDTHYKTCTDSLN